MGNRRTEDPEPEARRKLVAKRCDLIVGNRVDEGRVFGKGTTEAVLVERSGSGELATTRPGPQTKRDLADLVWTRVAQQIASTGPATANSRRSG